MKNKKLTIIACFLLFITNCFAQDLITKKNGDDISAKVTEITTTEIKYKKADNPNGPVFTILKSDVFMIRYENGSKDIFNEPTKTEASTLTTESKSGDCIQGSKDALVNYKGKRSGAGWTCATAILTSPILALIPAIACSVTEPDDNNLKYPSSELLKNNDYNLCYKKQAHKIKQKKVWTNFAIGSAVWLVLIAITTAG
ncbi:MAG: hypothetical protein WCO63_01180 [Bacteroidota bacterium]